VQLVTRTEATWLTRLGTRLEKDRDGCPRIVNMGASRVDAFFERKKLG
jgi:hypothetical protein